MHADTALENICALGVLDGDALREQLQRYDFDDERRWQLQHLVMDGRFRGEWH